MILMYGIGRQPGTWHVLETNAPMYSRVYYILGGNTDYISGSCHRHLEKGWLYLFPSYAPYEMTTDPADPICCLHLHLDLHTSNLAIPVAVDLAQDAQLRHLIRTIQDGIEADCPQSYLELLAQGLEQLCVLKHLLEPADSRTKAYLDCIRRYYRTDLPLAEIAASMGYSTEYFIRSFTKLLGVSPHQYAIGLRMSDAVRLLSGPMPLQEIALTVGYADRHSFSNAFRRYYGIAPGFYRSHYAGNV